MQSNKEHQNPTFDQLKPMFEEVDKVKTALTPSEEEDVQDDRYVDPYLFNLEELMPSPQTVSGIDFALPYVGIYSTLLSSGMSQAEAYELVAWKYSNDLSMELQKVINEGVKNQSAMVKQTQL